MNAMDILKYGHLTVLHTLEEVDEQHWTTPNVCGWWSTKDIIAHLTSFEHMLVEILSGLLGDNGPTPYLALMAEDPERFNEVHVGARRQLAPAEALAEYVETQTTTMALAEQIPAEMFRQAGALPWYGAEYDLDDFICYTYLWPQTRARRPNQRLQGYIGRGDIWRHWLTGYPVLETSGAFNKMNPVQTRKETRQCVQNRS